MHPLRRARFEASRLGPRLWRRLSLGPEAEAAGVEATRGPRLRSVALAGAALAVTSGAVAYCLGLGPAPLAMGLESPPDPTGYDASRLAAAGWRGRVGIRQYMANSPIEDRGLCSTTREGQLVLGVLDGHGGWQVAEYVQQEMLAMLEQQMEASRGAGNAAPDLTEALTAAFEALDENVASLLLPGFGVGFGNVARVGACTTLCVLDAQSIVIANAGDCRVVLGRRPSGPHPRTLAPGGQDAGPLPASKHARLCQHQAGLEMTPLEERRMPWVSSLRACVHDVEKPKAGPNGGPGTQAWELTNDHNARVPHEQLRLLREHPNEADIVRCKRADVCYVKGRLQPTRSIGDLYLKRPDSIGPPYPWIWGTKYDRTRGRHVSGGAGWSAEAPLPPAAGTPPYITATPEISRVQRHQDDVVLVAGTDGLWDYLSSQEAIDFAAAALERGDGVGRAAEELREEVLRRTARKHGLDLDMVKALPPGRDRRSRHDDITVVVVDLRGK